jgi:predicted DNA-binding ribbon-helix-helix protein
MKAKARNTRVLKRSIAVGARKTSISLEDAFWDELRLIAAKQSMTVSMLVTKVDNDRKQSNLSSEIRLFVLEHYRSKIARTGQS